MTTSIHVLRSNFMKISHQVAGETTRCFDDKKFAKFVFFAAILRHLADSAKSLQLHAT